MKRRQFLTILSGVCLAAAGIVWFWWRPRTSEDPLQPDEPVVGPNGVPIAPDGRPVFPERFRQTLRAMSERLLPDEPDSPGSAATDAFTYIEREAARPEMKGVRRQLMRGASQLDTLARLKSGKLYSNAAPEDQDAIIAAMIEGEGKKRKFDPPEFVRLMLALTLEGMFSDPIHGGNKEMQGWASIGYAMHPPRPCTPAEIAAGDCAPFGATP